MLLAFALGSSYLSGRFPDIPMRFKSGVNQIPSFPYFENDGRDSRRFRSIWSRSARRRWHLRRVSLFLYRRMCHQHIRQIRLKFATARLIWFEPHSEKNCKNQFRQPVPGTRETSDRCSQNINTKSHVTIVFLPSYPLKLHWSPVHTRRFDLVITWQNWMGVGSVAWAVSLEGIEVLLFCLTCLFLLFCTFQPVSFECFCTLQILLPLALDK